MSDDWVEVLLIRVEVFAASCSREGCPAFEVNGDEDRPCDSGCASVGRGPTGAFDCQFGYGLCDEAFGLSDCNRAAKFIWRAGDFDPPYEIRPDDVNDAVWVRMRRDDVGKFGPNVAVRELG